MNVSEAGIKAIETYEGMRLTAYADSIGVPTVGVGHTLGVKLGDTQPAELVALGTGATSIAPGALGNRSENDRLASASPFGLAMSKRKVVGTFTATGEVRKVLLMIGAASTSTFASAAAPVVAGVVEVTVLVLLA